MILQIFAVYDSKADAYLQPFFMPSKGQAMRSFQDLSNEPKTQFNKHPEDFTLFHIGEFDDMDATIKTLDAKIPLALASELKDTNL